MKNELIFVSVLIIPHFCDFVCSKITVEKLFQSDSSKYFLPVSYSAPIFS